MILRKGLSIVTIKENSIEIFGEYSVERMNYDIKNELKWKKGDVEEYIQDLKMLGFKEIKLDEYERLKNKVLEETIRFYFDGINLNTALEMAQEKIANESCPLTGESIGNNTNKMSNSIINENEDIDNAEIFDKKTGKTIRGIME